MKFFYHPSPIVYIALITAISSFSGLLLGFDAGIIGVSKDQVTRLFNLSDSQWSIIASASILGAFISLPICGKLNLHLGPKNILIFVALGFSCGIMLTAFSHGMYSFLVGRFVIGICIGMGSFMAPLFISEISPPKIRGSLLLMNSIALTAGQSLSFFVGYLIHNISIESWRYLILAGLIPSSILLLGMLISPNSPRWVAIKYGINESRDILKKIRENETIIINELAEINEILKQTKHSASFFKLFSKHITWIGILLGILQQLSGIAMILYFGPVVFLKIGFHPISQSIFASFLISIVNLITTIIVAFLIDYVGRRRLLLFGTLVSVISLTVSGILYSQGIIYSWLIFCFLSAYIIGYCLSLGSLFWVIIAEIYPLKIRGLAMSIAVTAETGASLIVTLTFLKLVQQVDLANTFWIYAVTNAISFIFIYFYVPETKGVSLEQIEKNVNNNIHPRHIGQNEA